jgi:hypothetical protein
MGIILCLSIIKCNKCSTRYNHLTHGHCCYCKCSYKISEKHCCSCGLIYPHLIEYNYQNITRKNFKLITKLIDNSEYIFQSYNNSPKFCSQIHCCRCKMIIKHHEKHCCTCKKNYYDLLYCIDNNIYFDDMLISYKCDCNDKKISPL